MASKVKFYVTNAEKLSSIPVEAGNMIFTVNNPCIYLDYDGVRIPYSIQTIDTDEERLSLESPINNVYYFVKDTNTLWGYFNDKWMQLTVSNPTPIVFSDDVKGFPEEGEDGILYSTFGAVYRWDVKENKYIVVANKTVWTVL